MTALIASLHAFLDELARLESMTRMFLQVFPYFMLFELPLNLLVMAGVLRWITRKSIGAPEIRLYRPRVSCIITCYSEGVDVHKTLTSLAEQIYPGQIEMIPVIDGAAVNQATLNAVRNFHLDRQRYPNRFLRPIAKWQRGGRVSSLNAGLANARGEIIMALDGDTSFDNNMVSAMVRHFADPDVPAVAGSLRVRNAKTSLITSLQALEYLLSIHMSKIGLAEWNVVNNVSGAFGAFRRSFLDLIGGWDTHTAEDLDLTLRIKNYFTRSSLRIPFEPEAIGHTDAPVTLRQFLKQRLRWDGDLFFLYMRKHKHSITPRLLGWPNFLMTLWSGFFFQIVLPFIITGYWIIAAATLSWQGLLLLFCLIYALYFALATMLFVFMLLLVSERQRSDSRLALVLPVFPLFMMMVRSWSAVAVLNDALRRGHEETSMAPWWVLKRAVKFRFRV
ncbi:glycosyltransferase family 2 protein [Burkholderia catarinensis]|uniref:glycosyltransferase family 2 protein n=1 Tax=Burkholderia catarinensis TaxID=1108140 RepID=UPI00091D1B92|nr:glycosyltransferase [Burkholderia catarinensis]KAG8148718.1 N-acetylglucosaminyltransferase [Burkholderia catarinensis]